MMRFETVMCCLLIWGMTLSGASSVGRRRRIGKLAATSIVAEALARSDLRHKTTALARALARLRGDMPPSVTTTDAVSAVWEAEAQVAVDGVG